MDIPADEFNFWRRVEERAIGPETKQKAKYFQECYKDIEQGWTQIVEMELKEIKELFEMTFGALDDVWGDKYIYPPKRFANVMKAFTSALWRDLSGMVPHV